MIICLTRFIRLKLALSKNSDSVEYRAQLKIFVKSVPEKGILINKVNVRYENT